MDEKTLELQERFIKAIETNDSLEVTILLANGLNPNYAYTRYTGDSITPIDEAIFRASNTILSILIAQHPNLIQKNSLYHALTTENDYFSRQIIKTLLKNKATISTTLIKKIKSKQRIQYLAIESVNCQRLNILNSLLKAGINLDFQVNDYLMLKTSPLDRAIALNLISYVNFLLQKAKVNPNTPINDFSYLLHAIDQKQFKIVASLMRHGAIFYELNSIHAKQ